VTQVEPAPTFWRGEEYHQHYLQKRGQAAVARFEWGTSVSAAAPTVIRTKNFVADAAAVILEQGAAKLLWSATNFGSRSQAGNTPAPVYARIAMDAHDLPWESVRFTFGDERCVAAG